MSLNYANSKISEEKYLQGELVAEFKHEFIDGEAYAMAGASESHNLLSLNMASELRNQLKATPCRTFIADMKVKVANDFFYPDVMVVCQQDNDFDYYKQSPVIIVEILSKSTRKFDKNAKRLKYQNISTLEEYVLIDQAIAEIEVFRKKDHWQSFYYYLGDAITFESLGVTVLVEDIYYQVNNDDVLAFLQEKNQTAVQDTDANPMQSPYPTTQKP
ncbi:MAG: Uma2 family endonuclease [Methylobacter sp.]|uniref:Uma2 family endonuclease n=1 Tax=Methylobacter sp. TaxID=2051955 RepID=UPI00273203C8|nr:Uma2 family endonuclease [Methylobacter sp.]MDP1665651.1 Uma2 family endonuclease [Methylobacter sp.]MDP1970876.1 Uma2 family endonuclease [Methylobacter sp.]